MRHLAICLLLATIACASASQSGPRAGRNIITAAQIEAEGLEGATAFEVVERFHNEWMLGSPGTSPSDPPRVFPTVYVNDLRMGELETLRTVPGGDILDIRLLVPRDADFRYGTGHRGGAIVIRTKRQ